MAASLISTDDWRAAYRQWVYAQDLLAALRQRLLSEDESPRSKAEAGAALGFMEEQVEFKRQAMDACLASIVARHAEAPAAATPALELHLVRLSIAVEEVAPGEHQWVAMGLFSDGSVLPVDRSARTFPSRVEARRAGVLSVPPAQQPAATAVTATATAAG